MAGFRKFEDILAWQKARSLTRAVYQESAKGEFARDYELKGQIRRASTSIMANIAEGFGRRSDKEFANFLNIAHGSAYEVQSHLYMAFDLNYISQAEFKPLYDVLEEICKILFALGQKLRS
jgi:four helix bundle protein